MAKLTLMQQLLGQPSQSYRFPKEKNYHSVRPDMLHAATPPGGRDLSQSAESSSTSSSTSTSTLTLGKLIQTRVFEEPFTASTVYAPEPPSPVAEIGDVSDSDTLFYTPKSSPRESISATDYIMSGPGTSGVIVSPPVVTTMTATRTPAPGRGRYTLSASSISSTSLDGHSLFSDYSNAISEVTRVTSPVQSEKPTLPSTSSLSRRGSNSDKSKRLARSYTDEEWSKDVRWLVNPAELDNKKPKPRRPSASSSRSSTSSVTTITTASATSSTGSNRTRSSSKSKSTMKSMAAVMEEVEVVNVIQLNNHTRSRHASASVTSSGSRSRTASVASDRHRPSPLRQSLSGSETTERASQKPLKRRRSRSLVDVPSTAYPTSGEIPSSGTQGYTSLILPRAPPAPLATFDHPKRFGQTEGKVDLTKIGAAQTTMASVEVVRGLGSGHNLNRGMSGLLRRDSSKSRHGGGPVSGEGVLGFTSYRKPPGFVPGSSLLVQVWSVGLDGVDARLIGAGEPTPPSSPSAPTTPKLSRTWSLRSDHRRKGSEDSTGSSEQTKNREPEVGFVPGRSFVGRVMECGFEVKEEDVRKGEWVVGLLDIKKCGALQEFIVVERHRIHRIPHPRMQPSISPPPPSRSSRSPSLLSSSTAVTTVVPSSSTTLSLSELALLPLSGVQAYRAVKSIINALPDGKRVLVLRGHDGVGAMAVQMLAKHGWKVCAHAVLPTTFRQNPEAEEEAYMMTVESRVASWGAEEVIFDSETVGVLERLLEDGDVFDAILDTVGGKDVWEASERLLRNVPSVEEEEEPLSAPQKRGFLRRRKTTGKSGSVEIIGKQFTTVVGDTPERAIPTAKDHFKAGMRSMKSGPDVNSSQAPPSSASTPNVTLRRKNVNVHVGYSWISVGQDVDVDGEDIRDSLGCILRMEGIRPYIADENVLPLESAPKAFRREPVGNSGMLMGNGTAVVRIAS